jgi:prevent-host-death family protein
MKQVGIHEAKTHLSRLVDGAARGEAFIIAKSGRPMVKVVPFDAPDEPAQRRIGFLAGVIKVPDDFDSMGADDIADSFQGTHGTTAP